MATRIISDPVRSGQQIYVADGDLVVSTTVSPGAEVVADGCVHIYGALRGRAIAGARGETSARIFCRRFEAEQIGRAPCWERVCWYGWISVGAVSFKQKEIY